jgi:general secretion pathway protein C
MAARLTAFLVWAALAASALFWGLKLSGRSPVAPPHTVPVSDTVVPAGDLSRLFGAAPVAPVAEAAQPAAGSRFQLVGIVAPRGARDPAVALIGVDGNPPRAYRVGRQVDDELVLQGVEARAASLGKPGGPATVRLELPPPPMPATGTLPPAAGSPVPGQQAARMPLPPGARQQPMRPMGMPQGAPPPQAQRPQPQQPPQPAPEQVQPEGQVPQGEDQSAGGAPVR